LFTGGDDRLYGDEIWVNLSGELAAALTNLVVRNWVKVAGVVGGGRVVMATSTR